MVADAFAAYEAEKRSRGVIDLDDLLADSLDLLRRDPSFATAARWRFRHLFVDEAQDLNPLQAALLDELRAGRDDLTLVGDPSQAIYGFNGADPTLLQEPERRFPGIEVVRLDTNYRCTPEIVAAGVAVLAQTGDAPALRSARPEGAVVEVRRFPDAESEATGVARLVREMRPPGGRWGGVAVLARTNAQLTPIAEALAAVGIPTRLGGAARASTPLQRALREAGEQTSRHLLASWAVDVTQFADGVPAGDTEAAAFARVAGAVEEFLSFGGGDGQGFLTWVRATDPFQDGDDVDAVDLLTFHASKGREWSGVVVTGACAGLVPHSSAAGPAETAEEVRLLYVALTRAARPGRRHLAGLPRRSEHHGQPAAARRQHRTRPHRAGAAGRDRGADGPAPACGGPCVDGSRGLADTGSARRVDPPVAVLADRTLAAIAAARPDTIEELADVPGVGPVLAGRLGPRILDALRNAESDAEIEGVSPR